MAPGGSPAEAEYSVAVGTTAGMGAETGGPCVIAGWRGLPRILRSEMNSHGIIFFKTERKDACEEKEREHCLEWGMAVYSL